MLLHSHFPPTVQQPVIPIIIIGTTPSLR